MLGGCRGEGTGDEGSAVTETTMGNDHLPITLTPSPPAAFGRITVSALKDISHIPGARMGNKAAFWRGLHQPWAEGLLLLDG